MTRLTLAVVFLVSLTFEAEAGECSFKFCGSHQFKSSATRHRITNTHRQIVGDIYDPGTGGRLQIRNNHRQILGYIERDGTITNRSRQPVAEILPPAP